MKPREAHSRHLRWDAFLSRISAGPPSVEPLIGTPRVQLFIEPKGRRIGALFYSPEPITFSSPLAEISIRTVAIGSENALEVSTENRDLYQDFYGLCCAIADRSQIGGQPVAAAVWDTLLSWAALLRRKTVLSTERQIGLLGELLFLNRIASVKGWVKAAQSWLGPKSEEHDFVLPIVDAEVKTTILEERIHHIGSLTQLLPKPRRPLYLISVQLTDGGDSKKAVSLPESVANAISAASRASKIASQAIRDQIQSQGWNDEDAVHYGTRYLFRAPMHAIQVNRAFPAITPPTLASMGARSLGRLASVEYLINVDGLGVPEGSSEFGRALFRE